MRNYIKVRWLYYQVTIDDGINPPSVTATATFGGDDKMLDANLQIANQGWIDGFPGNTVTFQYPNERISVYYLLDKDTLLKYFTLSPISFYNDATNPGGSFFRTQAQDSPRQGWKDWEGTKRNPPPSEKKGAKNTQLSNVLAPGVFDSIKVLQNLAAQLLTSKNSNDQRVGAIIIYQLGLLFTSRKNIVEVLTFLEPYLESLQK